jgi:hypothetical protein
VSLARYAKKRDTAEPGIIDALEGVGALVFQLDTPADLLVKFRELWHVMEVKTGRGKNLTVIKDKRQKQQQDFLLLTKTPIVRTPDEALRAIGAMNS